MSEQQPTPAPEPARRESHRPRLPADLDSKVAKDLEPVFQRVVANAVTLTGARAGSLTLFLASSRKPVQLVFYCPEGPQAARREHMNVARWVAEQRAPALLDLSATYPRLQVPNLAPTDSMLCVPLLSGQDVQGTLMISSPRPGAFNRQHLKLLEMLADLAAVTVRQTQQQEATAQQARALATVVELGRALSTANDMRHVLSLTTAAIRRLVIIEEAVLFSYEALTQELRGVAGLGTQSARLAEQRISISDMHSVTAWVGRQRRPLLHSSGSRAFVGRLTDTLLTREDLALLAVPLVAQNQLWGVITLARPQPFDTQDLRIMLNLGSFVAPALMQTNHPPER